MTVPTMTISIARVTAAGGPDPLVYSAADDSTPLGIVAYQAPAHLNLVEYAPNSGNVDGSEAVSSALQQAQIVYDWMCDTATSEADMQTAYAATCAAVDQFSYLVTTQVNGAPAQAWRADAGSVTPPARTFVDLEHPDVLVMTVTIPVYPVPGVA